MSEKLISLEEHDEQIRKAYSRVPDRRNGIACPACGAQLQDVSDVVYTSCPAQRAVECPACGYEGMRLC